MDQNNCWVPDNTTSPCAQSRSDHGDAVLSGNCFSQTIHKSALKWVQLHISEFGGDPDCVTLMGYSVGGMLVDALMSSPLSQGLFHR